MNERVSLIRILVAVSALYTLPMALMSQVYQHGGDWRSIICGAEAMACLYVAWKICR